MRTLAIHKAICKQWPQGDVQPWEDSCSGLQLSCNQRLYASRWIDVSNTAPKSTISFLRNCVVGYDPTLAGSNRDRDEGLMRIREGRGVVVGESWSLQHRSGDGSYIPTPAHFSTGSVFSQLVEVLVGTGGPLVGVQKRCGPLALL